MDIRTVEDWFAAVVAGNLPLVAGYTPRFKRSVNENGMTALMVAAQAGNKKLAATLLEHEQRIKDNQGRTALIHAIQGGHSQLCQLLVVSELDTSNLKGQSPFSVAIQNDAHDCLDAMLQIVGPVRVVDNPLLTAVSVGCLRCLRILLTYGQCFEIKEFDEALSRAKELGHAELCTELVKWRYEIANIIESANRIPQISRESSWDSISTSAKAMMETHLIDIAEIRGDLNERINRLLAENKELRAMLKTAEESNKALRVELADMRARQEDQEDRDRDFTTGDVLPQPRSSNTAPANDSLSKTSLQLPVDLLDEVLPLDVTETISSTMIQFARNFTLKSNPYLLSRRLFGEQSACDQSYLASLLMEQQTTPESGERRGTGTAQVHHRGPTYHRNTGYKRKKSHHAK